MRWDNPILDKFTGNWMRKSQSFFEEETEGIKVRPELLAILSAGIIVLSILANIFFKLSLLRNLMENFNS